MVKEIKNPHLHQWWWNDSSKRLECYNPCCRKKANWHQSLKIKHCHRHQKHLWEYLTDDLQHRRCISCKYNEF